MNDFNHFHPAWHHKLNMIALSTVFITIGVLWILRNLGYIDPEFFSLIVSWQMMLILLGVLQLIKQHFVGGAILIFVGGYFLFPQLSELGGEWLHVYWPVIFIFIGFLLLFKRKNHHLGGRYKGKAKATEYISTDGYVTSDVAFGATHQIVLDPVFKGAKISNSFGSTVLDLRRTKLDAPETYIDIECSFGSIELLISSQWNVQLETDNAFSGISDKRYHVQEDQLDKEYKLIIRGDISFGGLEIKN